MKTDTIFDKNFISELKKKIINYVSRSNVNINKITFNLGLYIKFSVEDIPELEIQRFFPKIDNYGVDYAKIIISSSFFETIDNIYYIKPEYEDLLIGKLTYYLVEGAGLNIIYQNNRPVSITNTKLSTYNKAVTHVIAEDVIGYSIFNFNSEYYFIPKAVKMIYYIVGEKFSVNTYFGQDQSLQMMIYSLSNDNDYFNKINDKLLLIERLICTLNSNHTIIVEHQELILKQLIKNKETELINEILDKLYIPRINNMNLDQRKALRDSILKAFLGKNYVNLQLSEDNKENYYFASLINNTVPINNVVTPQAQAYFERKMDEDKLKNCNDLYVLYAVNKAKSNVKEYYLTIEDNKMIIKSGPKKIIKDLPLVEEILSFAYFNSTKDDVVNKLNELVLKLCIKGSNFKCSLTDNLLDKKLFVAAIKQLGHKNGYTLNTIGDITSSCVEFSVIENKKDTLN